MPYTPPAPLPTFDTSPVTNFASANWNFQTLLPIVLKPWADTFGTDGYLIAGATILFTIIAIIWLRQDDAAIPMMILLIIGCVLSWSSLVPVDWQWLVLALMVVLPIVAIAYSIFRKR